MIPYIQIARINDGYLLGGVNSILHSLAMTAGEKNGLVRPQEFRVCPHLPCAVVFVKIKSWRKVPSMTQLFFTSLESVHGATLICQYKHSTMRVSYTPGLFQDVEMGLTEAKQSVLII